MDRRQLILLIGIIAGVLLLGLLASTMFNGQPEPTEEYSETQQQLINSYPHINTANESAHLEPRTNNTNQFYIDIYAIFGLSDLTAYTVTPDGNMTTINTYSSAGNTFSVSQPQFEQGNIIMVVGTDPVGNKYFINAFHTISGDTYNQWSGTNT